jgi:hypothetical protein
VWREELDFSQLTVGFTITPGSFINYIFVKIILQLLIYDSKCGTAGWGMDFVRYLLHYYLKFTQNKRNVDLEINFMFFVVVWALDKTKSIQIFSVSSEPNNYLSTD